MAFQSPGILLMLNLGEPEVFSVLGYKLPDFCLNKKYVEVSVIL